jgi:acylphosphatase
LEGPWRGLFGKPLEPAKAYRNCRAVVKYFWAAIAEANGLRRSGSCVKNPAAMPTVLSHARIQVTVKGRVQGVYFRSSTVQQARHLGLTGWVMNRRDGSVEVVAEGRSDRLEELVAWCRQGPPGARVDEVDVERQGFRGEFAEFRIRQSTD